MSTTESSDWHLPAPDTVVKEYARAERWLWVAAVLFWGVGDYVTTIISLEGGFGYETTEIVAYLIAEYGQLAHLGFNVAMFCGLALVWRALPRPFRIAVPVAFAVAGAILTIGNLQVIAAGL